MSDVNTLITGLLPDLNSDTIPNLVWWTKAELIQWADETVKRAARRWALFINRDASQVTISGGGSFNHATRHLATLHVAIGNRPLVASSSEEAYAYDESYLTTQADPEEKWFDDKLTTTTGYAPLTTPAAAGRTIRALYTELPVEIDTGEINTTIPGGLFFGDYVQTGMRAEARAKESDAAMPEVAQHDRELMSLYEDLFSYYWGDNK